MKIRALLNFAFDVIKITSLTDDTNANYVEEFYKEFNYQEKQELIKSTLRTVVAEEMEEEQKKGDFNAFLLAQKEETEVSMA